MLVPGAIVNVFQSGLATPPDRPFHILLAPLSALCQTAPRQSQTLHAAFAVHENHLTKKADRLSRANVPIVLKHDTCVYRFHNAHTPTNKFSRTNRVYMLQGHAMLQDSWSPQS